jgi:hypothetical protein
MNRSTISLNAIKRELKRRKVARTCILYLLVWWGGLQVADIAFSFLGFDPVVASPILLAIAILGFPIALIFSWFYQVTTSGITRTPPFIERRVIENLAPLNDRRKEAPRRGNPSRDESEYGWILEFESGPLLGQRHGVEDDILIGRSPECELTVPVPHISRQHARFVMEGDQLRIEDLDSANGTTLNGVRISSSVNLNHQDKVEVLDVVIRVKKNLAHDRYQDATITHNSTLQRKIDTQKT